MVGLVDTSSEQLDGRHGIIGGGHKSAGHYIFPPIRGYFASIALQMWSAGCSGFVTTEVVAVSDVSPRIGWLRSSTWTCPWWPVLEDIRSPVHIEAKSDFLG